nr:alpha/beta hydrolase [uncultured Sediminibacterium sp.]
MPAPLFIEIHGSRLHYQQFGHGSQWLCCFHGYGEEGGKFEFLAEELSATHTIIAFDMPFHGKTEWNGPLLLEPADLMEIVLQMVPSGKPIQLMGYSMGGRICLRLLELYPQHISSIILAAPDGLHNNPWQKLSTRTWIGNQLFRFSMQYPGLMFALMELTTQVGLFNKSISKFAHHYLDDAVERDRLYKRWTSMRRFSPALKRLKKVIATHQVPVHLLFGKYDRVIVAKHGYKLQAGIESLVHIQELEAGHHLLQHKFKPHFLKIIQH